MIPEETKKLFLDKFSSIGNDKFYKFLLNYAVNRVITGQEGAIKPRGKNKLIGVSPEMELMDYYDKFLVLYRKEGEVAYLEVAKLFRKAGHTVYRMMIKKDIIEKNDRFLNAVE
jgi:hypothetical protein